MLAGADVGHELDSREYGCIVAGEAPALRLKVVVPTSAYAADVGGRIVYQLEVA